MVPKSILPFLRFYGSLARAMFSDFRSRWELGAFWIGVGLSILVSVYQPLAKALSLGWQSLSPWWGVSLMLLLLAYSFLRVNYRRFSELQAMIEATRARPSDNDSLSDSVISIGQEALPLSGDIGRFEGLVLALRFKNVSHQTLNLRCRLNDLQRQLPTGYWEPE